MFSPSIFTLVAGYTILTYLIDTTLLKNQVVARACAKGPQVQVERSQNGPLDN